MALEWAAEALVRRLGRIEDQEDPESDPAFWLKRPRALPPGTWVVHFTRHQFDRLDRGARLDNLAYSKHVKPRMVDCEAAASTRQLDQIVWGFGVALDQPIRVLRGFAQKYGDRVVVVRTDAAVLVEHLGDNDEKQVLFPLCSETAVLSGWLDREGFHLELDGQLVVDGASPKDVLARLAELEAMTPNGSSAWSDYVGEEWWLWPDGRLVSVDEAGGHEVAALSILLEPYARRLLAAWARAIRERRVPLPYAELTDPEENAEATVAEVESAPLGITRYVLRRLVPHAVGHEVVPEKLWEQLVSGLAREALMQTERAIRVAGRSFEVWQLDRSRLEAIQRHVMERFPADANVEIEQFDPNKFAVVPATELLAMRQPGEVWRSMQHNGDRSALLADWKRLVNLSAEAMEAFLETDWGQEAGLSRSEAAAAGIRSGRDSARAIIRMKRKDPSEWTERDWDWARRQVAFIRRMRGNQGPLRDARGEPTRKLTSLWLWGHDPRRAR